MAYILGQCPECNREWVMEATRMGESPPLAACRHCQREDGWAPALVPVVPGWPPEQDSPAWGADAVA